MPGRRVDSMPSSIPIFGFVLPATDENMEQALDIDTGLPLSVIYRAEQEEVVVGINIDEDWPEDEDDDIHDYWTNTIVPHLTALGFVNIPGPEMLMVPEVNVMLF